MGSLADAPLVEALDQPTVEERRALIDRVAASAQFRRSARLRDFLLYVGGQSLKQGCPEIHEQEIGARVFGRNSSYDRSQDNIVRVNATELRKRIELYFATEGAHETLVLEIPRGGYKPIFHRRAAVTPAVTRPSLVTTEPTAAESLGSDARSPRGRSNLAHIVWASVTAAFAVACILLFQQNRAMQKVLNPWEGKPAVAAFWGDFLRFHQQTDFVLPDDSVSVIEDITHNPVSLGDYLNRNYMRQIQSSDISMDRKVDLDQIYAHNLMTFGGVRAAQQALAMMPPGSPSHLTLARYYEADAFKRNNVILLGGKKANPWVHLFDEQLNFSTDYDHEHGQAFVGNRDPKAGEQPAYMAPRDPNALFGYSVVAYLPSPSRTGNVIILAGTDSDATSAAGEFLTSEEQLNKFRSALGFQKFPYFEVLLKTSRLSGTSFSAEVVAFRTYPGLR